MFTPIDKFLYSDNITVVKIGKEYIFPIYKNGSSSLLRHCQNVSGMQLYHSDLHSISDDITVILRDPIERFQSGLATVIFNLKTQNPELDSNTIEFLLKKYLYLDIHYIPQFHWILNLSRFIKPEVKFHFRSMQYLKKITSLNETPRKANGINVDYQIAQDLYLQLDTILYNQIGNKLTFQEIMTIIKNDKDSGYYDIINIPLSLIDLIQ